MRSTGYADCRAFFTRSLRCMRSALAAPYNLMVSQPGRSFGRFAARWPCSRPVDWPTSMR